MTHATYPSAGSFASGRRTAGLAIDRSLPAYLPLKLTVLADQAGDKTTQRFLNDYRAVLPQHQDRIIKEPAAGKAKKAIDAILSLKAASAMVGAVRLSSYCRFPQHELAAGRRPRHRQFWPQGPTSIGGGRINSGWSKGDQQ